MPMVGDSWAATISDAIIAANPTMSAAERTTLEDAWKVVCNAHVTYITGNATVNTIVTGSCPTGAVTGTGVGTPPATGIT